MLVRPVQPSDHSGLNALHRAVWWPERSHAGWRWLDSNPARLDIGAPAGWVVEDADGPAAFVGNFVQRFWLGDRRLHGATGFSVIVLPRVKGGTRLLIPAFVGQPDVFASYTFNANARSCRIYGRFGMRPWPPRTHALKLSWIVDSTVLMQGRALRAVAAHAPRLISTTRESLMNRRLRGPHDLTLPPGVEILSDLGDASDYARYWETLKAEGRLVADRSPAVLRWRLADPDITLPPLLLAFRRGDRTTGHAIAMVSKGNSIDPPSLEIVDLIALEDEPHAIPALMQALVANARALGAAKVRLQTVTEEMLRRLGPWADRARREGGWGHCHVAFAEDAPGIHGWSPTPFDGDYGICLRPTPVPGSAVGPVRASAFRPVSGKSAA